MFKLASSTTFKPVHRQKQAVRFYMCKSAHTKLSKIVSLIDCGTYDTAEHVTVESESSPSHYAVYKVDKE